MSSEGLHAPRERLSKETIAMHQALKEILLHNMREEMEHACMALEWIRRNNEDFAKELKDNLFKEGEITGHHGD